jgi:hypothetical protein
LLSASAPCAPAGMRDLTSEEWERMTSAKRSNSQKERYPRMFPETQKLLQEFYAPFNNKLETLMNDDW